MSHQKKRGINAENCEEARQCGHAHSLVNSASIPVTELLLVVDILCIYLQSHK